MYFVLLALILIAFGVLAWRDLKLALTLLLAVLPVYLLRFEIVIPWTLLEGLILILFAVWLFKTRPSLLSLKLWLGPYLAPLLALFIIATVAIAWSPDVSAALGIWKAYYLEPLLVFVMLRSTFKETRDWYSALTVLAVSVSLISIFAIFQNLTGLGIPVPWDFERRTTSVFEYPNALGLFVAPIVAALGVIAAKAFVQPRTKAIEITAVVVGAIAIVLSETEAAFVAIPAALLLVLLISSASPKTKLTALSGAVVMAAIVLAVVPAARSKILLQDYSGGVRRSQWAETIELLKDKPVTGAGLSGYPTALEPYHDSSVYEIFQYPHNLVLNLWVELGLFGVIIGLWLLIKIVRVIWQYRYEPLVLASAAALLTMTIHGLVDVPFMKNDLAVLTIFFLALSLNANQYPARVNDV